MTDGITRSRHHHIERATVTTTDRHAERLSFCNPLIESLQCWEVPGSTAMRLAAEPSRFFCTRPFITALAIAILFTTLGQSEAADPEPKRVLMLHSFGLRFKPWTDYSEGIRADISRRGNVDFQDQSLVNARGADKSDDAFVDYLGAVYSKIPPDLIITFGAPAASFVQRHRDRLFPSKPMLFTAIEGRRVQYDKLTKNDTVVATHNDFAVPARSPRGRVEVLPLALQNAARRADIKHLRD